MDDPIARKRLDEYIKRAHAHENSAEYHRRNDARLGAATRIVSSIVGAGVFVGLVSKLGLDGSKKDLLSVPPGWEWLYWLVLALSLAGPALTALHLHLHDVEDAAKHIKSSADYRRLADDLERFLNGPALAPAEAERASKEFSDRSAQIFKSAISLTKRAKREVRLESFPSGRLDV